MDMRSLGGLALLTMLLLTVFCLSFTVQAHEGGLIDKKSQKDTKLFSDLKGVVLDTNRLLQESKAAIHIKGRLSQMQEHFQEELNRQEAILRQEEKVLLDLQKKDPSSFEKKRKIFEEKVNALHQKATKRRRELEEIFHHSHQKIIETILQITTTYRIKHHVSYVFPRASLVVFDPERDITDKILKELDQKLPTLPVETLKAGSLTLKKREANG